MKNLLIVLMFLFCGIHAFYAGAPPKKEEPELKPGETVFVTMHPMAFSIYKGNHLDFILKATFVFETEDQKVAKRIRDAFPILKDAFTRFLTDIGSKDPMRVRDLKKLKVIIQTICDRILGKGPVKTVLIQNFTERVF